MTLAEKPFDEMTMGQRVLWFGTCGCGVAEIAEWMQIPASEAAAMLARECHRYDPMRRPA